MSDYTPTTEQVRSAWAYFRNVSQADTTYPEALAQFDRWLADIKADVWDEAHAAGFCEGSHGFNPDECAPHENLYRQEQSNG